MSNFLLRTFDPWSVPEGLSPDMNQSTYRKTAGQRPATTLVAGRPIACTAVVSPQRPADRSVVKVHQYPCNGPRVEHPRALTCGHSAIQDWSTTPSHPWHPYDPYDPLFPLHKGTWMSRQTGGGAVTGRSRGSSRAAEESRSRARRSRTNR
jgi:hypothetical protein